MYATVLLLDEILLHATYLKKIQILHTKYNMIYLSSLEAILVDNRINYYLSSYIVLNMKLMKSIRAKQYTSIVMIRINVFIHGWKSSMHKLHSNI